MEGISMEKIKALWLAFFQTDRDADNWWTRKKKLCKERNIEIVRIQGDGKIFQHVRYDNQSQYHYLFHVSFLMKQGERFHLEEQVSTYQFCLENGKISNHKEMEYSPPFEQKSSITPDGIREHSERRFTYDRRAAVQYAEHWWNSYNPDFRVFDVDCTNYISQCLLAGGAPMRGAPVRERGWWYQNQNNNWSFSWAVAHSLRWYLSGSTQGLQGKEVESAEALLPGDVICYDFEGNGRWDHNTIVVAKDASGMPLVNAHTDNSRYRYWSYEDSTAWTPNIQYKFFRIGKQ